MTSNYIVERSPHHRGAGGPHVPPGRRLHQWTRWSPWEDVDPDLHRAYSGAEEGVGAVYAWSGNRKAGAGRMEIIPRRARPRW